MSIKNYFNTKFNQVNIFNNKHFIIFLIKFIISFLVFYYGTLAIIGLSSKEGNYNSFISNYFNYIRWLRISLLHGTKLLLHLFGVNTYIASEYNIKKIGGSGVMIVFQCVGYGIMSFWSAFIIAIDDFFSRKIKIWLLGFILFWIMNVCRLSLVLVANNNKWSMPLGIDHHTWFNILSYMFILIMMYFYEKLTTNKCK